MTGADLRRAAELLELAPDPRDVSGLGRLARKVAAEFPTLARSRWGESLEALRSLLPAVPPLPLSAEAEAVRAELLEHLGTLEADALAGRLRVLPLYLGSLRRRGPVLRELLSGLPSSAFPHADAARAAAESHALASGFRECWPLADGAERLASLTAPEPPHAPRVLAVPVWR